MATSTTYVVVSPAGVEHTVSAVRRVNLLARGYTDKPAPRPADRPATPPAPPTPDPRGSVSK